MKWLGGLLSRHLPFSLNTREKVEQDFFNFNILPVVDIVIVYWCATVRVAADVRGN